VGDDTGLGLFGLGHRILGAKPKYEFFFFCGKLGTIHIFSALDWPFSVGGWKVMAKNR